VSQNGTAVHASQAELKKSLIKADAEFLGPTSQTTEIGERYLMNTINGPIEIRIMPGRSGGGVYQGPRTIITRPGTKEYVHHNGARIEGAVPKDQRKAIGHIHGQRP
jgi:hypothetical protein